MFNLSLLGRGRLLPWVHNERYVKLITHVTELPSFKTSGVVSSLPHVLSCVGINNVAFTNTRFSTKELWSAFSVRIIFTVPKPPN